jgi:hypothetical protein
MEKDRDSGKEKLEKALACYNPTYLLVMAEAFFAVRGRYRLKEISVGRKHEQYINGSKSTFP